VKFVQETSRVHELHEALYVLQFIVWYRPVQFTDVLPAGTWLCVWTCTSYTAWSCRLPRAGSKSELL